MTYIIAEMGVNQNGDVELGKSFHEEASRLWSESSYLHISDNDGTRYSNEPV